MCFEMSMANLNYCFRAKVGKIVILNGTDDEWTIAVYPNIARKLDDEEKEVQINELCLFYSLYSL